MKEHIKLLTVEDAFLIEHRGLIVLPMITEYNGPMSFSVFLRKPNGVECVAQANLNIPRIKNSRPPYPLLCLLADMNKQDVPIGTEIWITREPAY